MTIFYYIRNFFLRGIGRESFFSNDNDKDDDVGWMVGWWLSITEKKKKNKETKVLISCISKLIIIMDFFFVIYSLLYASVIYIHSGWSDIYIYIP